MDWKNRLKDNQDILWLWNLYLENKYQYRGKKYSDYQEIQYLYETKLKKLPNLEEPQTFTEKMQWLKLHYRNPLCELCSNKVTVRDYIKQHGYEELLVSLIGIYYSVKDIDYNLLPNQFVIKASHGSAWNIVCKDKKCFSKRKANRLLNSWMRQDISLYGREWNYHNQVHSLIVEPYLNWDEIIDYKFLCFNGEPKMVTVSMDKDGMDHYLDFYDLNWKKLNLQSGTHPSSNVALEKPEKFEEMVAIARDLSQDFPFVRVDLYNNGTIIRFGELTFFPASGFWKLNPEKWDRILGEWLELPNIRDNKWLDY